MKGLIKGFIDLIYPPSCLVCGHSSQELVCPDCLRKLPFINSCFCKKCGKPTLHSVFNCQACKGKRVYFSLCRSLGKYEEPLKGLIHQFKYSHRKNLAFFFASFVTEHFDNLISPVDLITFIPMLSPKERERGYNQAELLGREIANLARKPIEPTLYFKRKIKEQNTLKLEERKNNVKDAFSIKLRFGLDLKGKTVLLVDDVYTTGSTVIEASKVLKKAGVKEVRVITLARVP